MAKDDYDDVRLTRGGKFQALRERTKQNTVKALYDAGDIGADALSAAHWWYADYMFAEVGHLDMMQDSLPENYERGDVHKHLCVRQISAGPDRPEVRTLAVAHEERNRIRLSSVNLTHNGRTIRPQCCPRCSPRNLWVTPTR